LRSGRRFSACPPRSRRYDCALGAACKPAPARSRQDQSRRPRVPPLCPCQGSHKQCQFVTLCGVHTVSLAVSLDPPRRPREAIGLAFVAALHHLSPGRRGAATPTPSSRCSRTTQGSRCRPSRLRTRATPRSPGSSTSAPGCVALRSSSCPRGPTGLFPHFGLPGTLPDQVASAGRVRGGRGHPGTLGRRRWRSGRSRLG
jgi:hypothetical protein